MVKKKVGTAGRFGARYGKKIRHKVSDVEKRSKAKYECPKCHKNRVRRISAGLWHCKKCNVKFGGKAYSPWE